MPPSTMTQPSPVEVGRDHPADALSGLDRRWTRIDHVPFGSTVDIEHVLLSTTGVFVVSTEFVIGEWSRSCPAFLHALAEARWRARKIEFLVNRAGWTRVTPTLILWGPGTPAIPGAYETVEGVLVCRGTDAPRWLAHLDEGTPAIEPARIGAMVDLIVDHINRTGSGSRVPARSR